MKMMIRFLRTITAMTPMMNSPADSNM